MDIKTKLGSVFGGVNIEILCTRENLQGISSTEDPPPRKLHVDGISEYPYLF